jgi:hypothetical protein
MSLGNQSPPPASSSRFLVAYLHLHVPKVVTFSGAHHLSLVYKSSEVTMSFFGFDTNLPRDKQEADGASRGFFAGQQDAFAFANRDNSQQQGDV